MAAYTSNCSFAPEVRDLGGVLLGADIGHDLEARTVEGDGRLERMREILLPSPLRALLRPSDAGHFLRGGVQPQRALVAVEEDSRPTGHLERGRLDARQRRQAQRTGDDRHVRGRASARGTEARHA
jgi:hypothetical protein